MKNSLETKLGYFVVLVVFAAWIIMETLGGMQMFQSGYRVSALFNTAQDLKLGDNVKMAGVDIGRVEKIALTEGLASVTMKLNSSDSVNTNYDSTQYIKVGDSMKMAGVEIGHVESFTSTNITMKLNSDYSVNTNYDSTQYIKVGDSVKKHGVEIGSIENIVLIESKVNVTMKLHPDAVVKTDSRATIKFTGLMGQNFVAISFGSPNEPAAIDGAVLATEEQPDLNAVMAKLNDAATGLDNFGKSFSGTKIDDLLGPLLDFVKQNSGNIGGAISNIDNITTQIASGQGTVGRMIYTDQLYDSALTTVSNIQDAAGSAKDVLSTAKSVINGVAAGQGTIGKLVTDETLYNATTASMTNLNQILLRINQGQGTIGKLVNDQEFYKNAKLTLQKVDKAADSLEDQGPLSVIGIMANQFGL